jgi:hypothetical protein
VRSLGKKQLQDPIAIRGLVKTRAFGLSGRQIRIAERRGPVTGFT